MKAPRRRPGTKPAAKDLLLKWVPEEELLAPMRGRVPFSAVGEVVVADEVGDVVVVVMVIADVTAGVAAAVDEN